MELWISLLISNNFFNEFKVEFINFSILELRNKLNSIDDSLKQDFFDKSKEYFYSLNLTIDDFDNVPFEFFAHYIFVINSNDYFDFKSSSLKV